MRLAEDRIKLAILHPDTEARQLAVRYFAGSYSQDPTVMLLVIQAVVTHGKRDAYLLIGYARDLRQTEATIDWIVGELNEEESGNYEKYPYNLAMVLCKADPVLLLPRESRILAAGHFPPDLRKGFTERLQMLSWDAAMCWEALKAFCEEGEDKQFTNEVDLGYAGRVVEALARTGEGCDGRIRSILSQSLDDYRHSPLKWMEPLMVRLAGEMRLESVLPLIVDRMHEDDGLLPSECQQAVIKIGTDSVVRAISEALARAERHFQIYAIGALEHIHTDLSAETCLRRLPQETDRDSRRDLCRALLSHFTYEAIEPVRQYLLGSEWDVDDRHLRDHLIRVCMIIGERFPEYERWTSDSEAERRERERKLEEFRNDPQGALLYALEQMIGSKATRQPEPPKAPPAPPPTISSLSLRSPLPRKDIGRQKVGRNDPCPCGSGKKFKNCCLRTQKGG